MDTSTHTPGWLVALLVVFTCAAAAVFGLFLSRHAQATALKEQYTDSTAELRSLRPRVAALNDQLAPVNEEIVRKRKRVAAAGDAEQLAKDDVERLVEQNKTTQRELEEAQTRSVDSYTETMHQAPERRSEVIKEEQRAFEVERQNDDRRRALREDVEGQSQTIEQLKKRHREERLGETTRVNDLESRVRQLTNQLDVSKAELRTDGLLVAGQARDGHVVIDRGYRDNLRQGSKFTVFTRRAGGYVIKGTIQVEQMQERISSCRVIEELDGNDPFIPGDMIHNPVYEPGRQRAFAVRGTFRKFSNAELERFITDAGYRLDREVSVNTDYLVVGTGADQAMAQAARQGVATLTEEQLVDYVRPRSGPDKRTWTYILDRARAGASFGLAGNFTRAKEGRIAAAISNAGGRAVSGVSAGMAGLIVGDDALDAMATARELGVPIISQDQFIDLAP